jgi:hypothetical protein
MIIWRAKKNRKRISKNEVRFMSNLCKHLISELPVTDNYNVRYKNVSVLPSQRDNITA